MNAIRVIAALFFSMMIFAAGQSMPCCAKNSAGAAMKCGAAQSKQDLKAQLMKMKSELKLSDKQIVKIADALSAKESPTPCCGGCAGMEKTEGKPGGCCNHSDHSDQSDHSGH